MNEFIEANRRHWDDAVPIHVASDFYEVASFKAGKTKLKPVELEEVGDVRGRTLLHLQCHFGLDTLSWARAGALVTGVDFSGAAIRAARDLAKDTKIEARFIQSDIYTLPSVLIDQFDVVFTSYGVLTWLPDLAQWARIAAGFVRPGGTFYMVEFHPMASTLNDASDSTALELRYPYFPTAEPFISDNDGTYADRSANLQHRRTYEFAHPLGEIVTSLLNAGLRIEFLHEFPFTAYQVVPFTRKDPDGYVRLTQGEGLMPLLFSIKATKPVQE